MLTNGSLAQPSCKFAPTIPVFSPGPGRPCTIRRPARTSRTSGAWNAGSTSFLIRQPVTGLPNERVNILLVVCRPFEHDVRYRSIARPLIELIQSKNLPAHVDILRPPTFDQLREHLRQHPGYYHVLHFDGHGGYGDLGGHASPHQFKASQGCLVFENEKCEADPKSARDLSALLHEYAVPAVVLNACQSATLDEQAEDAFATVATALLQSGMRSVVAMAYSLYVSGAQVFLPAFYRRLFESGSVAEGVRAGRQQMLADKNRMSARGPYPLEDWLLPVLYQQAPLDLDFAKQAKLEKRESRLPQEVVEQREAYGFIGRDGAILEMERALQRQTPCILVQGLGGVGKTTLARGFLRWLDETGGLDGALWFDFRDIRTAEYVLNRTGEAFYGENFGAQKNKLELLANALRQLRVLMVWDNFESAAQNLHAEDRDELGRFLDAIRGTRGKVIMTSRSQEEWMGPSRRFELPLSGLEGEERWEYCEIILRELGLKVNRDDPALKELMDQLAGHPLAMRVVAAQAGANVGGQGQRGAAHQHRRAWLGRTGRAGPPLRDAALCRAGTARGIAAHDGPRRAARGVSDARLRWKTWPSKSILNGRASELMNL